MGKREFDQYLLDLEERSRKAVSKCSMEFRDFLCAEVLANSDVLMNKHFCLFLKRTDQGEVSICGSKSFNKHEEYLNYLWNMRGDVAFCGFPGKEKDTVSFGVRTIDLVTSFKVIDNVNNKVIKTISYKDPHAVAEPFDPEAFFMGIEKQLTKERYKNPKQAS
jgi:hypothetical protein